MGIRTQLSDTVTKKKKCERIYKKTKLILVHSFESSKSIDSGVWWHIMIVECG